MKASMSSELLPINEGPFSVKIDMAYATSNNLTGRPVYKSADCYLHPAAAHGLKRATEILRPLNLQLKIWDAFRPKSAQAELFRCMPDPNYISEPDTGMCTHCRGIAIDLTIIDHYDRELDMGTGFDDFRPLAHHGNEQVSEEAQRNRLLLAGVMNIAGFNAINSEWWHYQLPTPTDYPIITPEKTPPGLV